jgi:hypothetical protein
MGRLIREDYYFDELGKRNTDDVVEAVNERISATVFSKDPGKRLEIREVIAMPRSKVRGKG